MDGHTASLFPSDRALNEREHLAVPVFLGDAMFRGQERRDRVTLTLPVLNGARQVLFLATGPSKQKVIARILDQGNPDGLPAGLVQPLHGDLFWFLDEAAAALLAVK